MNKLVITNERRTQLGLAAALLLLTVIAGLLYRQGRNRKKTNTILMVLNNQPDEVEDLLGTMGAMLLWSKEQMDDFKPTIRSVAVSGLFGYLQKFFPPRAVQFQFSHSPGLYVMADENYLQIIMQHLTSNALKALKNTPEGKIVWNARVSVRNR